MDMRKYAGPVIAAVLLAGLIFFGWQANAPSRAILQRATVLPEPQPLPEFVLSDGQGRAFTRDSLEGRVSLMFFGFTHCPDICPATLQQLAIVRSRLADNGAELPDVVFVSVDPQRDSPQVLNKYVGHFGAGMIGVTGAMQEIRQLTSKLGIYFEYAEGEGDDYSVNHSVVVLVINDDAEFQALFSAPHDIDAIVNDLLILMAKR
jgi:protein SCO1/2